MCTYGLEYWGSTLGWLKKWYLILLRLTLSIIRYVSRVKWSNPRNRVAPYPTPRRSSLWKENLHVALDYGRQLYLFHINSTIFLSPCINVDVSLLCAVVFWFSSCRAASTDIPDPLSPLLPIVHRLWQVFRATSRILTELLYVCSSWLSCFCSAICGDP